jgi:hypothetical protein
MPHPCKTIVKTVTSSEVTIAPVDEVPFDPHVMFMTTEGGNVRYTYSGNGQDPTPDFGHILFSSGSLVFTKVQQIAQFKMIATNTSVEVTITLEGQ